MSTPMHEQKQVIQAAQRLYKKRANQVKITSPIQKIHDELEIGEVFGRDLRLSNLDYSHIDAYFKHHLNYLTLDGHWWELDLSSQVGGLDSRMAVAKAGLTNEKMSNATVFGNLISVCSTSPIAISETHSLPSMGVIHSATAEQIMCWSCWRSHVTLVILENGEMLTHWHEFVAQSVANLFTTPVIATYRGHGQNHLHSLLVHLSSLSHVQLVGFFDFDPAGMCIAKDYQAKYPKIKLIMPRLDQPQYLDHLSSLINQTNWLKQDRYIKILSESSDVPACLISHRNVLIERRFAITQEHLVTHDVPLQLID